MSVFSELLLDDPWIVTRLTKLLQMDQWCPVSKHEKQNICVR